MSSKILTCTRKLHFCAGHRVMGHENKCAHLHGHNYTVFLEAEQRNGLLPTDDIGRVVDFSVLKTAFDPWIQTNWDHGFILNGRDNEAISAMRAFESNWPLGTFIQKMYLLPYNPTAENLARYLMERVAPEVIPPKYNIRLRSVRVWETENCYATLENDIS